MDELTISRLYILLAVLLGLLLLIVLVYLLRPKKQYPYERRELLTKREGEFYEILQPICSRLGILLLIKLRLADVMKVKSGTKDYMSYFNKIKAKHTDFILVDPQTLQVRMGIELDDPSHDRPDRIERDEFVDRSYQAAGIPLLHVWMPITEEELLDAIVEWLPEMEEAPKLSWDQESFDNERKGSLETDAASFSVDKDIEESTEKTDS